MQLHHSFYLFPITALLVIGGIFFPSASELPDISVIGNGSYELSRVSLDNPDTTMNAPMPGNTHGFFLGETEIVFDAALNPYVNGNVVVAIGDGEIGIEEGYANFIKGLPYGLGIKVGKFRLPFGKLNTVHPHAYPFLRAPRVVNPEESGLLPGEESFNDVGLDLSTLLPLFGSAALTMNGDFFQGQSFHPDTNATTYGWLGRGAISFMIKDKIAADVGASITGGTNNPKAKTATMVRGFDAKVKTDIGSSAELTAGGELIVNWSKSKDDSTGEVTSRTHDGFYLYSNVEFGGWYNAGILLERFTAPDGSAFGIKPFFGFSIMEESTSIRFSYEFFKDWEKSANNIEAKIVFMLGPHKTHHF